jgi:hypothetical protein
MRIALVLFSLMFAACAIDGEPEGSEEPADYDVDTEDGKADGVPATFDRHNLVADSLFIDDGAFSVAEVQEFLEKSPYNNRSWLADYQVNGVRASQMIVDAARNEGIHPLMLLVRMQGEATLVSKTTRPSATRINAALGCGCPDGSACSAQYRGFANQLTCGAKTLRRWYDASVDGSGQWRRNVSRRTLDPLSVTPRNHATASLYAYTPWVLEGRGGGWLMWNVTRKYARHATAKGYIPAN